MPGNYEKKNNNKKPIRTNIPQQTETNQSSTTSTIQNNKNNKTSVAKTNQPSNTTKINIQKKEKEKEFFTKLKNFSENPSNQEKYNSLLKFIDKTVEFNQATKNKCKIAVHFYTKK